MALPADGRQRAGRSHENWEWCLADDCSNDEGLTARLGELAARDARVRVVTRPENGHISIATNSAAELAHGEYIALMDHDDLLSPDCLAEVALHLPRIPTWTSPRTDDDKVDVERAGVTARSSSPTGRRNHC
ncbi:MAG: glycosyltransferase [Betaproteobacteria bacterium]|nr:glycosyltransferase [Betaproteobacteria bacterium]